MGRLRANAVFGTLSSSLTAGTVSITNAEFVNLPVVEAPNVLALTLDPDEVGGAAEIVYVTVHGAAAPTVTVERGEESTTARSHAAGIRWVHAATAKDFEITDLVTKSGAAEVTVAGALVLSGSPTGTNQAATKGYVDQVAAGQRFKDACRCATTANITIATKLVAGQSVDGITLVAGDRVLVKDQSTPSQNGIYVAGTTPARATDADSSSELDTAAVFVTAGTLNEGTSWVQTTNTPTVDTSAIVWAQTGGGRTNADDVTLQKVGSTMSIKDGGVSIGKIAGSTSATGAQYLNGVGGWTTPTAAGLDWTIVASLSEAALAAARGTAPTAIGRRIYVPAGTYPLSAQLTLNVANQYWEFHPQAKLVNSGGTVLNITASGVTVVGGIFDGGLTSRLVKGGNPGVKVDNATGVTIRNATIKDASAYGIYSTNTNQLRLERCTVLNSGSTGILHTTNASGTKFDSEDIVVDGCIVDRTEWHGLSLHGGGIKIIGDQAEPDDALNCAVSVANDTFTYIGHPLANGDLVRIANLTAGITGIANNTNYYVVSKTANTFKVAATADGTAIDITGSATSPTADVYAAKEGTFTARLFGVTITAATSLFTSTAHGLSNGMRVRIEQLATTGGYETTRDYYVIGATTDTFQLAASRGGAAVTASGSNGSCWIRLGYNRLRRVKVVNCDVRLPDLVAESMAGSGHECLMCQEYSEAAVMYANNTSRGGSMGVSISGPRSVTVANNVCTRFSKIGVELAGAHDFTVTGNVVDGAIDETAALFIFPSTVSGPYVATCTASTATNTFTIRQDGEPFTHGFGNGSTVIFTSRTGGNSIVLGRPYYVRDSNNTAGTFQLAATKGGSAISIGSDLTACTFTCTSAPDLGIVAWVESSDVNRPTRRGVVVGNSVRRIEQTDSGKGIRLSCPDDVQDIEGAGPKRVNVTLASNAISVGGGAYGIQLVDVSGVTILGNQIDCFEAGSAQGSGVRITADASLYIDQIICNANQIYGAGTAIHWNATGTATIQHSVFRDNVMASCTNVRASDGTVGYGDRVTWWGNRGYTGAPLDDEEL